MMFSNGKFRLAIVAAALITLGAVWYVVCYSMDEVEPFEVAKPNAQWQVLVATQGSQFKQAVVHGVIEALQDRSISIQVVDVHSLFSFNVEDWSAVVILHTWESGKAQASAQEFVGRQVDLSRAIVMTTSGSGDLKLNGVDAITSASAIATVPTMVGEIVRRLDAVLMPESLPAVSAKAKSGRSTG